MQTFIHAVSRLIHDLIEWELRWGAIAIVRGTWFSPTPVYEAQSDRPDGPGNVRALLLCDQVQLISHARERQVSR